jgi:ABC transporter DrrB family efflux protein
VDLKHNPLYQLFLARVRDFYREPVALFWVYGFPLILAIGLGIAFASREPEPPQVDVQAVPDSDAADALANRLNEERIHAEVHDEPACRLRLRNGKTALYVVIAPGGYSYVYDSARAESVQAHYQVDDAILRWRAGSAVRWQTETVPVTEKGSRYIDFLMPGLMGLNLMGGGLWGLGFVIVDMRVRKLLKRLLATPMRRSHFLLALLTARSVLMLPDMLLLLCVAYFGFQVPVRGNPLVLALVIVVGAAAFAGIGMVLACRTDKTETISGLMNLVMLPMWLFGGAFFPSTRFPDAAQPFIQALPLTQLNDALRAVMLEGATLYQVSWRLAILAAYAVVCFVAALRWFRWR